MRDLEAAVPSSAPSVAPCPRALVPRDLQPAVSAWVERFIGLMPVGGTVLDVACGGGRNLTLALARGCRATGIDRDLSRLDPGIAALGVELIAADLEDGRPWPLGSRTFDAVIVTNYLWRPLLPAIRDAVAPAGVLIYETFAVGNEQFGRPSNPQFLLRPEELIDAVRPRLTVLAYEHLRLTSPDRVVQRIVAAGPGHPAVGRTGSVPAARSGA